MKRKKIIENGIVFQSISQSELQKFLYERAVFMKGKDGRLEYANRTANDNPKGQYYISFGALPPENLGEVFADALAEIHRASVEFMDQAREASRVKSEPALNAYHESRIAAIKRINECAKKLINSL